MTEEKTQEKIKKPEEAELKLKEEKQEGQEGVEGTPKVEETKPAEGEPKPAEGEPKPAEKPTEGEEKPTEGEEKPTKEVTTPPDEGKTEKLKEQLSVIGEVRKELANAYKGNKESNKTIEQLNKEVEQLGRVYNEAKKTIEQLNKSLGVYRTREEEAAKNAYNKRLEQLSKDFEELGQVKTVEQLSKLPTGVITEFESIVGVARNKKSQEQLSAPETVPTQAMPPKAKPIPVQQTKTPESLGQKEFMTGLCKKLTEQQGESGSSSKRTLVL